MLYYPKKLTPYYNGTLVVHRMTGALSYPLRVATDRKMLVANNTTALSLD